MSSVKEEVKRFHWEESRVLKNKRSEQSEELSLRGAFTERKAGSVAIRFLRQLVRSCW